MTTPADKGIAAAKSGDANQATQNLCVSRNIDMMKLLAERILVCTREASDAIHAGNRNGAIGAMMRSEKEIETIDSIYKAMIAIHRISF